MDSNERSIELITVRQPLTGRYLRFYNSLRKISRVKLVTGAFSSMIYLGMNPKTLASYMIMLGKSIGKGPTLLDAVAAGCYLLRDKRTLVVDFRMPLAPQLSWLNHSTFGWFIERMERACILNRNLVITTNDILASMCREMGANLVEIVPNYPTGNFKPTVQSEVWRDNHGIAPDTRLALFTGGVWIREIYGLDMLLNSWRIVENSTENAFLIILGELPNDYTPKRIKSLNIKHLILPGRVTLRDVANWVNSVDLCLAPRTPGFPANFYNDKDSTKISEYVALRKPIVAAGYAPSDQYLLVDRTPEAFANGIMKGFDGKITPPEPHFWEENESSILSLLEDFWFGQ